MRVNIFVSVIRSISNLPIDSAEFYIDFDETTDWAKKVILSEIAALPFEVSIRDSRLESYEDWRNASMTLQVQNSSQLLLFTNDDHLFVDIDQDEFRFMAKSAIMLQELKPDKCIMVPLSHYTEVHAFLPIAKLLNRGWTFQGIPVTPCVAPIGAILIDPKQFIKWWIRDFTNGNKIVGPENPFGPSVIVPNGYCLVPRKELFRHMDGYGHINISGVPFQVIDPPFEIQETLGLGVVESKPIFLSRTLDSNQARLNSTIYVETGRVYDEDSFLNALVKANSKRLSLSSIAWINTLYELAFLDMLRIVKKAFISSSNFRSACMRSLSEIPISALLIVLGVILKIGDFNNKKVIILKLISLSSSNGFVRFFRKLIKDVAGRRSKNILRSIRN